MAPYLALLGISGLFSLTAAKRMGAAGLLLALLYFIMIGWRHDVGVDWNNYARMYRAAQLSDLQSLIQSSEPGFGLILWTATELGGGVTLVNVVSAAFFCVGLFTVASRCREPFLALVVATPFLVVTIAMATTRQAVAIGIIYFAFGTWNNRSLVGRVFLISFAALFHSSAIFNVVFVVLGSRVSLLTRIVVATLAGGILFSVVSLLTSSFDYYVGMYVSGGRVMVAPGAVYHVLPIAIVSIFYLLIRGRWRKVNGDDPLLRHIAIASALMLPATLITSVGASRMSAYFWPATMLILSGLPALIATSSGRLLYRSLTVVAMLLLLWGWLEYATSAPAWLPYRNSLWRS